MDRKEGNPMTDEMKDATAPAPVESIDAALAALSKIDLRSVKIVRTEIKDARAALQTARKSLVTK
jgi:hypothetical protein